MVGRFHFPQNEKKEAKEMYGDARQQSFPMGLLSFSIEKQDCIRARARHTRLGGSYLQRGFYLLEIAGVEQIGSSASVLELCSWNNRVGEGRLLS